MDPSLVMLTSAVADRLTMIVPSGATVAAADGRLLMWFPGDAEPTETICYPMWRDDRQPSVVWAGVVKELLGAAQDEIVRNQQREWPHRAALPFATIEGSRILAGFEWPGARLVLDPIDVPSERSGGM